MANVKISGLPAATSVTAGTDVAPLVSGGITTKATPQQIVNAGLLAPGAIGGTTPAAITGTTITATTAELIGPAASANLTRFPNALAVVSNTAAGIQQNETHNMGIMAEGTANASNTAIYGVGVYGVGYTASGTRCGGVIGEGHVSASADTGSAIGVRGYANDTHAGGLNIGLYGDCANGSSNYALYLNNGDIYTASAKTWNLNGNLTFSGAYTVTVPTLSVSTTLSGTGVTNYFASPPAIGSGTASTGAFTTLSASSTVSGTGFSTYLASPPAIGGTAAAAGAFTTLSASSTVSGTGFSTYLLSPPAIGTTAPAAGKFTDLTSTGNTTIGDASTDTFTVYPQTISLINSTAITAASTKTLTLNGGAGTNGLVLDASNNVGIGVTPANAGQHALQIANYNATVTALSLGASSSDYGVVGYNFGFTGTSGSFKYVQADSASGIQFAGNAIKFLQASSGSAGATLTPTQAMTLDASGSLTVPNIYTNTTAAVTYVAVSSAGLLQRGGVSALKYKQDIRDLESIDINKFRPVRYKSKCENDDQTIDYFGFIADEVEEAGIKELIIYNDAGEPEGFQYERMTVVLLKAIQELLSQVSDLKEELNEIKAKVN
jgi:hypothetical protein